jgi:chaperonin GroEL
MSDNIHTDALPKLAAGIKKATDIVSVTMGPKGKNVEIQSKMYPFHRITNDGATILKSIVLSDPIEAMGLSHLQEAADRSNNNSGDGSTTTSVLLNAILEEGIKTGNSTLELKESLDECLPIIEQSIQDQTRQITVDDIPAVARIAGEDEELATVLGEIYKTIGKDGIIHLEGSGTYDTSFKLTEGVRFIDTGYLSPYMAHDEQAEKEGRKQLKAVYNKPAILITKNKISDLREIDPILQALVASNVKDFVIFTDDMDSGVARALIELQKNPIRTINILIIKAPTLWKTYVFEDMAKITGATIIEDASGTSLNNFRLEWLGTCDTIITDKDETTVIGIQDITDHVNDLEEEGSTDSKLRLSWLTTKTAILKLGSKSETELSYRLLKCEDAIFSAKLALQHGVVEGGGLALKVASYAMPDTIGGKVLRTALTKPNLQIIQNANGNIVGMFGVDVVDASSIVLGAIRNSLGIASTLLTTSSVIVLPEEKQAPQASPFPFN